MPINNNINSLYDHLKKTGFNGSELQFRQMLQDDKKRKVIYDRFGDRFGLGDYSQFSAISRGYKDDMTQGGTVSTIANAPESVYQREKDRQIPQAPKQNKAPQVPSNYGMPSELRQNKLYETIDSVPASVRVRAQEEEFKLDPNLSEEEQLDARERYFSEKLNKRYKELDEEDKKATAGMNSIELGYYYQYRGIRSQHDPELRKYSAALEHINNARQSLAIEKERGNNLGVWRGMKHAATDFDTYTPLESLKALAPIKGLVEKYERDPQSLTKDEMEILNSVALSQDIQGRVSQGATIAEKIGAGAVESIPFMAEMALNPISGAGRAAEKAVGKKLIKEGVKKTTQKLVRGATRVGADILAGGAMAATTGLPKVTEGALQRELGDIQSTTDKDGNVVYGGRANAEESAKAWLKSFGDQTIENHSEFVGEYFGAINPLLTKVAQKIPDKGLAGSISKFLRNLKHSPAYRMVGRVADRTKFDGIFGEFNEEIIGGIENALIVGDQTLDTADDTGVFNPENLLVTLGTVSLTQGAFTGANLGGYMGMRHQASKAIREADTKGQEVFGADRWADIKAQREGIDLPDAGLLLSLQLQECDTPEEREAVLYYHKSEAFRRGVESAESHPLSENAREYDAVNGSYRQGLETENTEIKREIVSNYTQAMDSATEQQVQEAIDYMTLGGPEASEETRALARTIAAYQGVLDNNEAALWTTMDEVGKEVDRITYSGGEDSTVNGYLLPVRYKTDEDVITVDRSQGDVYYVTGGMDAYGTNPTAMQDGDVLGVSDDSPITIYNPSTGKTEMVLPSSLEMAGTPVHAQEYKAEQQDQARVLYLQQLSDEFGESEEQAESPATHQENQQAGTAPTPADVKTYNTGDVIDLQDGGTAEVIELEDDGYLVAITGEDGSVRVEEVPKDQLPGMERRETAEQAQGEVADEAPTSEPTEMDLLEQTYGKEFTETLPTDKDGAIDEGKLNADQSLRILAHRYGVDEAIKAAKQAEQKATARYEKAKKASENDLMNLKRRRDVADAARELKGIQDTIQELEGRKNDLAEENKRAEEQQEQERWNSLTPEEQQAELDAKARAEEEAKAEIERKARQKEIEAEELRKEKEAQRVAAMSDGATMPEMQDDDPAVARARENGKGVRLYNGTRVERNAPIKVDKYTEAERKFGDNDGDRISVRRTIVEATQLQPSHEDGLRNPRFFLDEAQPKDRTDIASKSSAEKIALNLQPEEITTGTTDIPTAYSGAPIVNDRGEVIQGNNRTAALRLMYRLEQLPERLDQKSRDAVQESVDRYKKFLAENAEQYGMTAEEVMAMQAPVAVDIAMETDAKTGDLVGISDRSAIRLGQRSAGDTESGGNQKIDARRAGRVLRSKTTNSGNNALELFSDILYKNNDSETNQTAGAIVRSNALKALQFIREVGAINDTQFHNSIEEVNGAIRVTDEAVQALKDISLDLLFDGADISVVDAYNALPPQAQRAIARSLRYEHILADKADSLLPVMREAIAVSSRVVRDEFLMPKNGKNTFVNVERRLLSALMNRSLSGEVSEYTKYDIDALEFAALFLTSSERDIVNVFNQYYSMAGTLNNDGEVVRQSVLFGETPTGMREILDVLFPERSKLAEAKEKAIDSVTKEETNDVSNDQNIDPPVDEDGGRRQERQRGDEESTSGRERPEKGARVSDRRGGDSTAAGESQEADARSRGYELSDEVDPNGYHFVKASDGTTVFGEIRPETGLTPAPIKLSEGVHNPITGKGYGLLHFEARHGEELRNAGYKSATDFVETVAKNYSVIKKGKRRGAQDTYLIEVQDDKNNTLFIELIGDGSAWTVNSGGRFKSSYSKGKEIVWSLPTVGSNISTGSTEFSATNNSESAMSGNSPQTTYSKEVDGSLPALRTNSSTQSGEVADRADGVNSATAVNSGDSSKATSSEDKGREKSGSEQQESNIQSFIDKWEELKANGTGEEIDHFAGTMRIAMHLYSHRRDVVESLKSLYKEVNDYYPVWKEKQVEKFRQKAKDLEEEYGVKIRLHTSPASIESKKVLTALREGEFVQGWFDVNTQTVHAYLPNNVDESDLTATYLHEVIAHYGIAKLLTSEQKADFLNNIWDGLDEATRKEFLEYANGDKMVAAEEWVARFAESGAFLKPENKNLWDRIVDAFTKLLESIGLGDPGRGYSERLATAYLQYSAENLRRLKESNEAKQQDESLNDSANEKASSKEVSNTDRIEDYGEKFGGAAKDLYKEAMVSFHREVGVDDLKANPLSKVFPRPKLGELVEEGSVSQANACLVEALYNEIGNKPRTRRVVGWAKSAKETRDLIVEILDNPLKDWSNDARISKSVHNDAKLLEALNFPANDVNIKGIKVSNYVDAHRGINDYMVNGFNGTHGYASFLTYDEAVAFVAKKLEEKKQEKAQDKRIKKSGGDRIPERKDFKVGQYGGQGDFVVYYYDPYTKTQTQIRRDFKTAEEAFGYVEANIDSLIEKYTNAPSIVVATNPKNKSIAVYISKPKNKSRNVLIKDGFKSWSDAKLWVQDNYDDLKGKAKDLEGELNESWEDRERVGADHRKGVDVDAASFVNDFGFRGVEFGNWVNQKERQEALNSAYDGLMDLCELIGVSPKALSLNGRLGLAFGSRGRSKAMAHFEPDKKVINLTKMKGSGSLAHEWLHALDNYFSGEELKFASDGRFSDEVRKEMQDAWNRLTDAISKSNMAERSKSLDAWKNKVYWGTRIELAARAFQGWVKDRIERNGGVSDYLNNYFKGGDDFFNEKFYPYPLNSEDMNAVYDAFDHLFDTMEERIDEETGNVVLFRRSLDGANSKQKQVGGTKVDLDNDVLFRLTKRGKSNVEGWLKKREDLTNEEREAFMQYLEPMDNNLAVATGWWYAKGVIRVPEDQSKVDDAVEVAKRAKVDPMRYGSPMEVLDTFKEYKIKGEAIDPESVPQLSGGRNVGDVSYGIRVYDVEDSKAGQQAMREIINTHWGEDANPWCLLQGDGEGNLYPDAWDYWNHYNKVPKRVAFKDGKLLAFCANDESNDCWWDRKDKPHNGIPVTTKMPNDELGRTATYEMSSYGKLGNPTNVHRGDKQNGLYEEWYGSGQLIKLRTNYKNGNLDGLYESYYDNGQLESRTTYKNNEEHGLSVVYHSNGQLYQRSNFKDGKLEGLSESYYSNGRLTHQANYKNGNEDGLYESYYESGQLRERSNYKNGKQDGLYLSYYENGQLSVRVNYKDGKKDGLYESYHLNGQLSQRTSYKDGEKNGLIEWYYENGKLLERSHLKDGEKNGLVERYYENGNLYARSNYKDGVKDGLYEAYSEGGRLLFREVYKNGYVVEDLTDDVRFRRNSEELEGIKRRAEAEGKFMKAPNGEATKLSEKQWLEVRSRAFKDWFGDWEKPFRIKKLKNSKPIDIEFNNEYEYNRKSIQDYLKLHFRGEYVNIDTNDKIDLSRVGVYKVTSHSMENEAHLKSIVAIPQLIERSIFIEELKNEKDNDKFDSYRYYVAGAKIDGVDYTIKLAVGVDTNGNKYYDHSLTEIEKGNLIEEVGLLSNSLPSDETTLSQVKDTKLLSILKTDYSKVVDENGEPLVMYHGTPNKDFSKFDIDKPSLNGRGEGKGFYFIADYDIAKKYAGRHGRVIPAFLNVRRFWSGFDSLSPGEKKIYLSELNDEKAYDKLGIDAFHVGGQLIVRRPNQIKSATDNVGDFSSKNDDIYFRRGEVTEEMGAIKERALAEGTLMKAPNGKPTNLSEFQWLQVRTKAFKKWFGDWEKPFRIKKLRNSKPIDIEFGNEYQLDRNGAKNYLKDNIRGEYKNADTGEVINVSKVGINEVTAHSMQDEAHVKSLVAIPAIIENSIFLHEEQNSKDNDKYDSYRYYVIGMNLDGEPYTVKMVVGVKGDSKYYDHSLTKIEKGNLIDNLNGLSNSVAEYETTPLGVKDTKLLDSLSLITTQGFSQEANEVGSPLSDVKDTKLLSILKTDHSKVVDENGEPLVVYHGTSEEFTSFDWNHAGAGNDEGMRGRGFYFSPNDKTAGSYGKNIVPVYVSIKKPFYPLSFETKEMLANYLGVDRSTFNLEPNQRFSVRSSFAGQFTGEIKYRGHDGIIYPKGQEVIAFYPNQIKSATDNEGTFDSDNEDIRFRKKLNEVNEQFNKELQQQIDGKLKAGHVYQLGMPSAILRSAGVPDLPIELAARTLNIKSKTIWHKFDLSLVRDLPRAVQMPIMVFDSHTVAGSKVVLTELKDGDNNFVAVLKVSEGLGSMQVNDIRSVYPKDHIQGVIDWINAGSLLRYADKEKALDWLNSQHSYRTGTEIPIKGFVSATKLVKDFENPKLDDSDVRFRSGRDIEAVNEQFNEELKEQIAGKQKDGHVYQLGMPSDVLRSAGVPDLPIELAASRLKAKSEQKNHPFDMGALKGLPIALSDPIAVFDSKSRSDSKVVLTELKNGNDNFVIVLRVYKDYKNRKLDVSVNDIVSLYPKDSVGGLLDWINEGFMRYVDKEKASAFLSTQEPNYLGGGNIKQKLLSATKIVKDFENPKLPQTDEDGILFRVGKPIDRLSQEQLSKVTKMVINDSAIRPSAVKYIRDNHFDVQRGINSYLSDFVSKDELDNKEIKEWQKISKMIDSAIGNNRMTEEEKAYALWNSTTEKDKGVIGKAEDILMRKRLGLNTPIERENPLDLGVRHYEEATKKNFLNEMEEAYVDYARSIKALQDGVLISSGKKLNQFEDVYTYENTVSSRTMVDQEDFMRNKVTPLGQVLQKVMSKTVDDTKVDKDLIEQYPISKHGIERNRRMSEEAQKNGDTVRADYSGLSSFYELPTIESAGGLSLEAQAQAFVDKFEEAVGKDLTDLMWSKINDMTNYSLEKAYATGLISKDTCEEIKGMYEHYIPLRGWDEDNAEDYYEYLSRGGNGNQAQQVLKKAKGRSSRARSPLETAIKMAESTIILGNKNLMKQRLLALAQNHPSALLSVSSSWVSETPDGKMVRLEPNLTDGMTAEEQAQEITRFEERMEELSKDKDSNIHKFTDKQRKVSVSGTLSELNEHAVRVKRNGREYVVWVNGNPKAAQAINGLLNVHSNMSKSMEQIARLNRVVASNLTARDPGFIFRNLVRDVQSATTVSFTKYGTKYTFDFHKRIARNIDPTNKDGIFSLYKLYENDKLDPNNQVHKWFKEFIKEGGQTGYTQIYSIKDYEKKMRNMLNNGLWEQTAVKVGEQAVGLIEFVNTGIENATRFSAYCASRNMGRTVMESIEDAKEVSVNFNRKGSGAYANDLVRSAYIFVNPSIQALSLLVKTYKTNPLRFIIAKSGWFAFGFVSSMAGRMLSGLVGGGDDDDTPIYYRLSDWMRMNNLILPFKDGAITIPMPHEDRVLYGAGVATADYLLGKITGKELTRRIVGQIMQIAPLEVMEEISDELMNNPHPNAESTLKAAAKGVVPTVLRPITDVLVFDNKDFLGRPITGRNKYNEQMPEYTKGLRSTHPFFVNLSKVVNDVWREEGQVKGVLDTPLTNPALMEYATGQYLGGMYKFPSEVYKTTKGLFGNEQYRDWRNVPILNSFYKDLSTVDNKFRETNDRYRYYKGIYDNMEQNYMMAEKLNDEKKINELIELRDNTPWLGLMYITEKDINKMEKNYYDLRNKNAPNEEIEAAGKVLFNAKKNVVQQIENIENR